MSKKTLKRLPATKVTLFKIKNRRGFAAICMSHLTEGRSPVEAFYRMVKAVKRSGYSLQGNVPRARG